MNLLQKTLFFLTFIVLSNCPDSLAQKKQDDHEAILFAVLPPSKIGEQRDWFLTALARLDEGKLLPLFHNENVSEVDYRRFEKEYLIPDQRYPILFGGSRLGFATIKQTEISGCSVTAPISVTASTPNKKMGLSVTSTRYVHSHANRRRNASPQETISFKTVARNYLLKNGLSSAENADVHVTALTVTEIRKGGPDVVIGSITVRQSGKIHDLLLAVILRPNSPEILLASLRTVAEPDSEVYRVTEEFLDQIDLAGDGTDEIVTVVQRYESWECNIYKAGNGAWKLIYTGGAGGC